MTEAQKEWDFKHPQYDPINPYRAGYLGVIRPPMPRPAAITIK